MFTVKLCKGHATKLVCGVEVNIYPAHHNGDAPAKNDVREVSVVPTDGPVKSFFVADPKKPRPKGWAEEVEFFDVAYIENGHGATTETVRAY